MFREGILIGERYEIIERVGSGGMSEVYKAKDHKLNRFVAIKVLKREFSEDINFVQKFKREAQSAAGLMHPNIVNVYDVGQEGNTHYIVMELVDGITLKKYIENKGKLSPKEVVSIGIQAALGIDAAHKNNIIHRDIKPQNIIISKEGKVKITDFGIARAASSETVSSNAMGSVHYISPEQARGGYSDVKSDIYSLGITLYEMVTGRVPFDGDTTVSIAIQHLQDELVEPSKYVPDVPISLEQIILKCTQKSPERRYHSAEELITDLKKSLITPNEQFVQVIPGINRDQTIMFKPDEIKKIKSETDIKQLKPEEKPVEAQDLNEDEEEDEEINPKLEKAITIMGIVAGVIIVIIFLYLIGSFFGIFKFGPKTENKKSKTEQSQELKRKEDSDEVKMINVVGKTYDEGKVALNKIGLGIHQKSMEASDEYPKGTIIDQNVKDGDTVEKNTTIEVVVSSGEATFEVPDVTGLEEQAAINKLSDYGLNYTRDYQYSNDVQEGCIISMDPVGGTAAKKGDSVRLVVSRGREIIQVTVPNVQGMSESDAKSTLENSGLAVGNVTSSYSNNVDEGDVISQTQEPGKTVEKGTSVDLVISMGKEEEEPGKYIGNIDIPISDFGLDEDYENVRIILRLTQKGKTKQIYDKTISASDGMSKISLQVEGITGETTGTVKAYVDGVDTGNEYSIVFVETD
ncbi:Stk1 family PASTA domain-containing Ser/Thr kinase [Anaerosacchariphilus polymeriproducens]|uniref:non-specific serine/threonine protein kinase n=1 Tax=Anaerosacchariphilus polymeriproducens TaxID=1812858 RepID=A0A371AXN6_9FIRM|nr:Stk1 family PASTA domain-containing Ser/Thr kinase [Anaerosacchariphilus polymeriproducens]RDU24319.1 Stk1 family PASTA domain-containing Ser/Thr kinase [Anaerosacchariphilus polymeriproducens]